MSGRLSVLLALAVIATGVAGCIELPDESDSAGPAAVPSDPGRSDDRMTADARTEETQGVNAGFPPVYHVTHTTTIKGTIDLDALPVGLQLRNGPLTVRSGPEGSYSLTVALTGYGVTEADARRNLERMSLEWAHEKDGAHFLVAVVNVEEDDRTGIIQFNAGTGSSMDLVVPSSLLVDLDARTTNGAVGVEKITVGDADVSSTNGRVDVADVTGESLRVKTSNAAVSLSRIAARVVEADTTNGAVDAKSVNADKFAASSTNGAVSLNEITARKVDVKTTNGRIAADVSGTVDVRLKSTNGAIKADVRPGADGMVVAKSTNSGVHVRVPEGARYGYDAELDTTNGRAHVGLKDGSGNREDDEATFRTTGFERRSVRVAVELDSTNSDVRLDPL